jgi:peptidoglycan/LPS O-acetylase OafA/YrhL
VYFPLWLLGLGLYRLCRRIELGSAPARAIFILSILLWAGFEALVAKFHLCPSIAADIRHAPLLLYGSGLCFALSVIGFQFSGIGLCGIAKPVRWLAGATFTLYLLHFPLVWFLNGLLAESPLGAWPPALRWALLIATTFGLVLAAAEVTERRKALWRRGVEWIFTRMEQVFDAV